MASGILQSKYVNIMENMQTGINLEESINRVQGAIKQIRKTLPNFV